MKIRIIKGIVSIWGRFRPGDEINHIPKHAALNWIKNGIAESLEKPEEVPAGLFWCLKHQALHKLTSKQGQSCSKRQAKEDEKAAEEEAARIAAEAEAKAEAEAEGKEEPGESTEQSEEEPGASPPTEPPAEQKKGSLTSKLFRLK